MRWALWLGLALWACDDGPPGPPLDGAVDQGLAADAAPDQAVDAGGDAAPPVAVRAAAGPDQVADVGAEVQLDGSGSVGAISFQWDFGDGRRQEAPGADPAVTVRYAAPGRYRAVLTVYGADGRRRTDGALITVTHPPRHASVHSASLVAVDPQTVAALDADGATLTLVDAQTFAVERRATGPGPRRLAALERRWIGVTLPDADAVEVHDRQGGEPLRVSTGAGRGPFGIIPTATGFAVTLQSAGAVMGVELDAGRLASQETWPVAQDLRGIAILPDGRWVVSRWRSPPDGAQLFALDPGEGEPEPWGLAVDRQLASDTEIGGVPTWLDQVVVSPTGAEAAVPALQANVDQGLFLNGERLDFDLALRAVVGFIDPSTGAERFEQRKQFDGRGFASAAAYSPRGDFLYVATRGSRTVERLDRLVGTGAGTLLDVGFTPEALLVHGGRLWVHAALSRELVVYDLDAFDTGAGPIARVPLVDEEPLDPTILRGKILFNDSADPRLSRDGYIACAHCHLDGDSDNLVWDFTDRGEGLRNTISLLGRAGMGHGPLHWSANFDEVQDFEHDLRGPFAGDGLLTEAEFAASDHPLGPLKAGVSADLDALAAYVTSLGQARRSPFRVQPQADPSGQAVFDALACADCHPPPTYTDSGFLPDGAPRLHAIGTLGPGSGQRLGEGPLPGVDTPTLIGLWDSKPFLHDGSAADLAALFQGRSPEDPHGLTERATAAEVLALIEFLLSLDGRDDPAP